jgi:hypothetical protein
MTTVELAGQLGRFDRRARLVLDGRSPSRAQLEGLIADGVAAALELEARLARLRPGPEAFGLREDLATARRLVRDLMRLHSGA